MDSIEITEDEVADPAQPVEGVEDTAEGGIQVVPPPADEQKTSEAERPEWLPEKFKTPADMAKAYKELEQKLGAKAPPPPPPKDALKITPPTEPEAPATPPAPDPAEVALAAELHTYAEKAAGGKAELAAVLSWATENLSADEQAAYNTALDTRNPTLIRMAMDGVMGQYQTANGVAPRLTVGGEAVPSLAGVKQFESNAQITEAMSNPKYKSDPAYRAMVARRLSVSRL